MNLEHNHSKREALFVEAEKAEADGNLQAATQLLLAAAKLGHTGAQVALGNSFSSGRGVPRSLMKAAYWYRRAYEGGDESGALNLGINKLKVGNTRSAIPWLKRAVELHSGEAALELAKTYLCRRGGKRKAVGLLKMTQQMRRSEISEQAKEDAAMLLSSLAGK